MGANNQEHPIATLARWVALLVTGVIGLTAVGALGLGTLVYGLASAKVLAGVVGAAVVLGCLCACNAVIMALP